MTMADTGYETSEQTLERMRVEQHDRNNQAMLGGTSSLRDSIGDLLVERGKTHGDYSVHARLTQGLKKLFDQGAAPGNTRNDLPATHAEAIDMLFHKIGRIGAGDASFKDHWDDIAGYAKLVADRLA
jgi:hypothetical protein